VALAFGQCLLVCLALVACNSSRESSSASAPPPASASAMPAADDVPYFEFDPSWPATPLPNNWIFGNIGGVHVDDKDQIWVLQRGNTVQLDLGDDYAALDPPASECCIPAPSVVVIDQAGKIVKAWGGKNLVRPETPVRAQAGQHLKTADGYDWPREHGIFVDHKGNVWLGCDEGVSDTVMSPLNCGSVTKFTNDGAVIWQKGKYGQTKGNMDRENFNSPSGIFVDQSTNEAYISDGYRNKRIAVIDADTGEFKRIWGPYGIPNPPDIPRDKLPGVNKKIYDPEAPPSKLFGDSVHCIELSRDGLVYVCDRANNRVQIFKKDGTFVNEVFVAKKTRQMGAVFDVAFSPDPDQTFMYVADGANHKVHILRRKELVEVGAFGHGGRAGGEFGMAHVMATDSKGNIYVGETVVRDRIQRFKFMGMRKRG
jgi:DNA-binding beta-propeller fold protein YncE